MIPPARQRPRPQGLGFRRGEPKGGRLKGDAGWTQSAGAALATTNGGFRQQARDIREGVHCKPLVCGPLLLRLRAVGSFRQQVAHEAGHTQSDGGPEEAWAVSPREIVHEPGQVGTQGRTQLVAE